MSRPAREIMADIAAAGLAPDHLALVFELATAIAADKPEVSKGALRTRRWRANHPSQASQNVTSDAAVTHDENVTERHKTSPSVTSDVPLSLSSSTPSQNQNPKTGEEKKERGRRMKGETLPAEWAPSQGHYDEGSELGCSRQCVDELAKDMRIWARSNEHREVARKSN